jgi:fimbrial chaperone protein
MSPSGIDGRRSFRRFLLAVWLGVTACNALAGSIEISPVMAALSERARVAVLTVRNTGEDETVMQVSLIRWPSSDAMYAFEPANELLVTPSTFRLRGGAQQIVRVGLRGDVPSQTEAAYRLIIEEVPILQEQDTTRMRLVVRHDLPVFVAPAAAVKHQLDMVIDCAPEGAGLHLRNLGNTHLKVLGMTLKEPASGVTQGDWKTFEYLLPRGEAWWLLSKVAPQAHARAYTATATTEQGVFPADVQNQCN